MIEPSRLRIKSKKLVRAEADHKRSDAGHDQKRPRRIKDQAVGEAADHEQNKNEESESPSTLLGVN